MDDLLTPHQHTQHICQIDNRQ